MGEQGNLQKKEVLLNIFKTEMVVDIYIIMHIYT